MGVMGDRVAELETRIEKLEKALAELKSGSTAPQSTTTKTTQQTYKK